MRAEIDVASPSAGGALVAPSGRVAAARRLRRGPDWFELLVLLAFAAISMWVVVLDVHRASVHGLVWSGTDGIYIVDQMQYLSWIQSSAKHFLVANLFVLHGTTADYFQPAVAISGGLVALGVPPYLALLLWKPVAVLAAFYGVRAYARASLEGTWARRIALALGLFFGSVTIIYGSTGVIGDLFPAFLTWGYTFGLLAIALMLFALVAYARAHGETVPRRRRMLWLPGVLGAVAGLLHPWQAELLILIVIGAELVLWLLNRGAPRRLRLPLITVILTGAPLIYYEVLGRVDLSWKLARVASKHSFSLATIILGIVPLLLPALLAYRQRPRTFLATATRVWPAAALLIYVVSASSVSATPLHSFEGITVPLSVLAIDGVRRVRLRGLPAAWTTKLRPVRRWLAAAVVLAATVPAIIIEASDTKAAVTPAPGNGNFITHGERAALRYLANDTQRGGVLTRFYLGTLVPGLTGRRTYVGDCLWSEPECTTRAQLSEMLFDEQLPPATVRWIVQQLPARFVLADCRSRPDMAAVLAPLTESVHRFGCAAVYTLRAGSHA
jgi:hypothetical protein